VCPSSGEESGRRGCFLCCEILQLFFFLAEPLHLCQNYSSLTHAHIQVLQLRAATAVVATLLQVFLFAFASQARHRADVKSYLLRLHFIVMKFLLCCPSSLPLRHAEERVSSVAGFYTRHIRAIATSVLSSDAPLIFLLLHCTNLQPLSPLSVCMSICLQSRPRCAHAVEFNGGATATKQQQPRIER
jgi:hypothetical protein